MGEEIDATLADLQKSINEATAEVKKAAEEAKKAGAGVQKDITCKVKKGMTNETDLECLKRQGEKAIEQTKKDIKKALQKIIEGTRRVLDNIGKERYRQHHIRQRAD